MDLRLCEVLEHGQSHRAVPGESWPLSLFHTRSAPNRASLSPTLPSAYTYQMLCPGFSPEKVWRAG